MGYAFEMDVRVMIYIVIDVDHPRHISMAYSSCSNRDGAIQVRSNVDPTFDSLVGSGRSGGDHHGSSLLENPYIPYQCMDSYLSST
ncbi:hypothetical protein RJ640_000445, partial [Escallonia rubra]